MACETDALAMIYAKSLYELASDAGGQAKIMEVGEELESICELAREHELFREFLRSPIVATQGRASSLRGIFSDRITDLTLRFLLVLNSKGRLSHLEPITQAYDQMIQESFGRVEVDLFTAVELTSEQLDTLQSNIKEAIGKEPVLHPYTDPDMLGGLKLLVGDQLIDGSVATRLARMRDELRRSGANAMRGHLEDFLVKEGSDG